MEKIKELAKKLIEHIEDYGYERDGVYLEYDINYIAFKVYIQSLPEQEEKECNIFYSSNINATKCENCGKEKHEHIYMTILNNNNQ